MKARFCGLGSAKFLTVLAAVASIVTRDPSHKLYSHLDHIGDKKYNRSKTSRYHEFMAHSLEEFLQYVDDSNKFEM